MKIHEEYCTTIHITLVLWLKIPQVHIFYFRESFSRILHSIFPISFAPAHRLQWREGCQSTAYHENLLEPQISKCEDPLYLIKYGLKPQKCIFFTSGRAFQGSFIQSFQSVSPQRTGFNEEKDVNQPWDSYSCWYIIFPHQYTTTTWNGINVSNLSG